MYNNRKFWTFATICFAISTLMYILSYGVLNFYSIFNLILFLVSVIVLVFFSKNYDKNVSIFKDEKTNNKNRKSKNKKRS